MSYEPIISRLPSGTTFARAARLCAAHGFGLEHNRGEGLAPSALGLRGGYVLTRGGEPVAFAHTLRSLPWRMERVLAGVPWESRERWGQATPPHRAPSTADA